MSEASFRAKLALIGGQGRKAEPSAARAEIRRAFADIKAARERAVTWQQITDLLTAEGLPGLTADKVRALYHAERRIQGERVKRRRRKPTQVREISVPSEKAEPASAVISRPANGSGNPYAELDQRLADEASRREKAEARRKRREMWNPLVPGADEGAE